MSRNILDIPNPDGQDTLVTYTTILLERAPDNSGSPGIFAQIDSFAIDTSDEMTHYVDPNGALTDWYKYRYQTADAITQSDYSDPIQYGDYTVRKWIIADIPDAAITTADWDRWRDQTMQDINSAGVGRPAAIQSVTPTSYTDEWHNLNYEMRRVTRVEKYDSGGNFVTVSTQWNQYGNQIRLVNPNSKLTYKIYGIAEIRSMQDLDDELFNCLYWGMRWRYLLFRTNKRMDTRSALGRTKQTDYPALRDFQAMAKEAKAQFDAALVSVQRDQQLTYSGGR